jgi:DnaJ homolog subfamily C member 19
MKLLWLVLLASIACRLFFGRWPWQMLSAAGARRGKSDIARNLLGVPQGASRQEIIDAHRRLIAQIHPDRGGTSAGVHEANEARDLLLADLEKRSENR